MKRQTMGVARLSSTEPGEGLGALKLYELSVPDQVAVFFQTAAEPANDKAVRSALAMATDRQELIDRAVAGQATALSSPLLPGRVDLSGVVRQPGFNLAAANQALDQAGWPKGGDGVRAKAGKKLELHLVTQRDTPYERAAEELKKQWARAGAKVTVSAVDSYTLQQSYIRPRRYDALIYGINLGADPDVYAYWDSSQAQDPGLNLSVYKSGAADVALESGRTVKDPAIRLAKYRSFVATWVSDAPAVMLYTPTYIYGVNKDVLGVTANKLVTPADRFYGIERWAVRSRAVTK